MKKKNSQSSVEFALIMVFMVFVLVVFFWAATERLFDIQKENDKVHYLNKTAVLVLESCTGRNTAADIEAIVKEAYKLPEAPQKEVADCLDTLFQEGLIK